MASEGTSSSSDQDRMEATQAAVNILAQGKRNMLCGEVPTAVNQFQEACSILSKAYGETAKECADAYFCYGQALLDLARMENGVLGNALQGVPEDTDDDSTEQTDEQFEKVELKAEEREKLRQEVYDAMGEKTIELTERKIAAMEKLEGTLELSVDGGVEMDCDDQVEIGGHEGKKTDGGDTVKSTEQKSDSTEEPDIKDCKTDEVKTDASKGENENDVEMESKEENAKLDDDNLDENKENINVNELEEQTNRKEIELENKVDTVPESENKIDKVPEQDDKTKETIADEDKTNAEGETPEDGETKSEVVGEGTTENKPSEDVEMEEDRELKDASTEKKPKEGNEKTAGGDNPEVDAEKGKSGDAVEEKKSEKEEENKSETEEKSGVEEKLAEGDDKSEEKKSEEGEEEGSEATEEEEGEGTGEDTAEDTADDVSQDDSEMAENPDDVSNLQLAWEMLELAKMIYLKDESNPAKLRVGESHLKLGEVSLETEQYEEAVKDFNSCLEIQKAVLEPDNRLLAETYYQLGLAYCFNKQFAESTESYQAAIKVIESRKESCSRLLEAATKEEKESKDFDSPVYKAQKEMDELEAILPDLKGKIEDIDDEKKNMDELKNLAKQALGSLSDGLASASSMLSQTTSEPVQTMDISHLVKRKRKSEDPAEEITKKAKQDVGDSGDAPSSVNGHSKEVTKEAEAMESKS